MNNKTTALFVIAIFSLLLAACQFSFGAGASGISDANKTLTAVPSATSTRIVFPTRRPAATATVTPLPASATVEVAARTYFAALQKKDFAEAAQNMSDFSLMIAGITRAQAADQLKRQNAGDGAWSSLQVKESQKLDESTILVHVVYQSGSTAREEWWPFRLEKEQWLYNWNNLIDFKTLQIDGQTTGGVTLTPTKLVRYSDRIQLFLLMQNRTNDGMYFGHANETLALFQFGNKAVEAEPTRIILARLQSYTDQVIEVKGLFNSYPDSVEIRKWKSLQVPPWYVFTF